MNLAAVLLDGLISGTALATVALAFSVVYLPTRIFHVALGAIFAATPFMYTQARTFGLSPIVAILLSVGSAMAASTLIERWNHAPLARRAGAETTHFVTSLGLFIVLVQLVAMTWGEEGRFLRQGVDTLWDLPVLGIAIGRARAALGLTSGALIVAFMLLLYMTPLGLRFRALAQNPTESALRGLDVAQIRQQAFAVSGFLAGASALIFAADRGYDAYLGFDMVLLAVVAVIVGGRDSFLGPIVGGLMIGMARELVRAYLSAGWLDAVSFILLAAFLIARPMGLLGRRTRVEEEFV